MTSLFQNNDVTIFWWAVVNFVSLTRVGTGYMKYIFFSYGYNNADLMHKKYTYNTL